MPLPIPRVFDPATAPPSNPPWSGAVRLDRALGGVTLVAVDDHGELVAYLLSLHPDGIVRHHSIDPILGLGTDIIQLHPDDPASVRIRDLETDNAALRALEADSASVRIRALEQEMAARRKLEAEVADLRAKLAEKESAPVLTLGPVERGMDGGVLHLWWHRGQGPWCVSATGTGMVPCRRILGLDQVPPPEVTQ